MLRITPNNSSAGAKTYFSTADYYLSDHELAGTWHGKGAVRLGLTGPVTRKQWEAMCDNLDPDGKRLTQRVKKDRRVGYDFTFNAPKSVSLLYTFTKDERVLAAFQSSIDETMRDIESEMNTRVRVKGADSDRLTGEAVWGSFTHFTTRPEDGIPDPHLHTHCFVFNSTWDTEEQRWKAAQFGDLKRDGPYFEALFHSRMAEKLERLGIPVERSKDGYEIEGVGRATVRKFSRRTARIEAMATELGITNPEEKAALGAKTRNRKADHLKFDELARTWQSWLSPEESRTMLIARHRLEAGLSVFKDSPEVAKESVAASLEHHLERASVVPERKVLATAIKRGVGRATAASVRNAYERADIIWGHHKKRRVVTTREVLAEEQRMLDFARRGRGTCSPLAPAGYQLTDTKLSDSQRQAVTHILQSPDRVILFRGGAGTGKTRSMRAVIAGIEAGGRRVFTFAPSADASRGVLREEGVSDSANTVAYLLKNERLHDELRRNVILVDESGLVGTKTLRQVFELADRAQARVLLIGDTRQHGAVERGAALRLLESEAGLVPAELSEIRRQEGEYRDVVQALADGNGQAGFTKLQKLGWVHELPDEERYTRLAADYAEALAARKPGERLLVVAPTHKEGAAVTRALRAALKETGQLGKNERTFATLRRADFTLADRRDPIAYSDGDVIEFQQNAKGHAKGDRIVAAPGAANIPLDLADRFQLFHSGTIALAPGDDIRLTAGGETLDGHRLNNGAIYTVKGFTPKGDVRLTNDWVLDKDFGHIVHGWVSTSHSSQAKTVARVFIAQSAASYPASSSEQWYVSISRGKVRADVYTDSTAELLEAIKRSDERLTATELVTGKGAARLHRARQPNHEHPAPRHELTQEVER